ncbi:DUF2007 domain-containing protein [Wenzhouxiangella sp. AB-CW3]|uniref:putative signal transducing protein n=1 Tax=Wenzhouxiangella sp. AB-CW3 TaxID=2771012 RepID=UPI00168B6692|nr:DUF2007 domain-containing protein [Wenzhouxiangella sp. AB-CW3]QOC22558.1 DUF2007 domain-containing protein [Wenzhouxiangella sp. AB-CW3]
MITIAHPTDDMELLFIRMALEAEGIPYLVVGDGFGSLYPGVQLPIFNERPVRVYASDVKRAVEVIEEVRKDFDPASSNLSGSSKLRIVLETIFFGWFVPGGKRRSSSKSSFNPDASKARSGRVECYTLQPVRIRMPSRMEASNSFHHVSYAAIH